MSTSFDPALGNPEKQVIEDFVDSSAWTVGQRMSQGNRGYHLRSADPNGITSNAGGEIWTAPVSKSLPEGLTFYNSGQGNGTTISFENGQERDLAPSLSIAPPVDRLGGLPVSTTLMGPLKKDGDRVFVARNGWDMRTDAEIDSYYRKLRQLLSPDQNGDLQLANFGLTKAVVAKDHPRVYRELEGRPYEHHYSAYKKQGPMKTVIEDVEERIPRKFRKDKIVTRQEEKKVPTYVDVPAGVSKGVHREAIIDPGLQPLVIGGENHAFSRIFYPEDHKLAVTPESVALDMASLMQNASPAQRGVMLEALDEALHKRHPEITERGGQPRNEVAFTSSL